MNRNVTARAFAVAVGLQMLLVGGCSRSLPDEVKKQALTDATFVDPIEIALYPNQIRATWEVRAPGLDDEMFVEKVLIVEGYCERLPVGRPATWFVPTDKARANWREVKDWPSNAYKIAIAKRAYLATTFENRWEGPDKVQMGSFTFSYEIRPILQSLPKLGPYEGKVQAVLDQSDGRWKIAEFSVPDRGLLEYEKWLQSYRTPRVPGTVKGAGDLDLGTQSTPPQWMPTYPGVPMKNITFFETGPCTIVQWGGETTDSPQVVSEFFASKFSALGYQSKATLVDADGGPMWAVNYGTDCKDVPCLVTSTLTTERGNATTFTLRFLSAQCR